MSARGSTIAQAAAGSVRHPLALTLLTLTFTTGLVDAASYLGLGRVFTANMTGNVVLLGFGIAGGANLPVVAPLISMAAFLIGASAGGVLARHRGETAAYVPVAVGIEVVLTAVAAGLALTLAIHPNQASGDVLVAILGVAMGVRNATARKLAVPDLTTTVLTMTLTGLAADAALTGGSGRGTVRRGAAFLALLTGALAGAALVKTGLWTALATASVLGLVTAVLYNRAQPAS